MPKRALSDDYYDYSNSGYRENIYTQKQYIRPVREVRVKKNADTKKVQRNFLIHRVVSVIFVSLLAFTILPYGFKKVTMKMFNPDLNKNIRVNYEDVVFPTANYVSNHWFMGMRSLEGARVKRAEMQPLNENTELKKLEASLKNLASTYPSIHPSVYVWDYNTGNYAAINEDESFPTASIIKLPVLAQLFRAIEKNHLSLDDKMYLTDYYRAEGSGSLQYKAENSKYSIDDLARVMITESDNSATNMLVAKMGSMTNMNSAIRRWGLKNTYMQTWLPDMEGTNRSTVRDMAQILYNIDSPEFLSNSSRAKIFDYMGHVHNNRLIAAGLPDGAEFLHKTGDIGKMLGDAGIVYAPNGKKYIVVIFVNRPHNSPLGKEFIVQASQMIYNYMVY